jgi:regulatory protein
MAQVTAIKTQKNGKRVNIYLDGKFGFGLDLENFVKLGLKVEQTLTETEVEKIIHKADFQKSLDKLLRFATIRPRSEKEIKDYFKRKKVHESMREDLFSKLKHFGLIDDDKFAKWWVEQRLQFRPKPKSVLYNELRIKGINKEIVNQVICELVNPEKEIEMARYLLEKKKYRWKNLSRLDSKRKMSTYLVGKGFSWEVVKKVVGLVSDTPGENY